VCRFDSALGLRSLYQRHTPTLEDITHNLQGLATRPFREPADAEEAVEDVLQTVRAIGDTTIQADRLDRGWSS
jgi:hypothetical protein